MKTVELRESFQTSNGNWGMVADDGEKYYIASKRFKDWKGGVVGGKYEVVFEEFKGKNWVSELKALNSGVGTHEPAVKKMEDAFKSQATPVPTPSTPVGGSPKYSSQDLEAFKKKDEWMAKMNAWNNAVVLTGIWVNASIQAKSTIVDGAGAIGSSVEYWAKKIYRSITGKEWEDFRSEKGEI